MDKEDYGIVPRTSDYAYKTIFKTKRSGSFDAFAVGGSSEAGDLATSSIEDLKAWGDQDEFYERQTTAVAGIKHSIQMPNNKTSIRSTLAFIYEFSSDRSRRIDTLLTKNITYYDFF